MTLYLTISVILGALPFFCICFLRPWMPRSRWLGVVLAIPTLWYCAANGAAMLPEGNWRSMCYALIPVVSILSYLLLDFLFARVLGGILAILANEAISQAFAYDVSWRPLYCTVALILGISGMILIAWPWWLRDICTYRDDQSTPRKRALCVASIILGTPLILLPFF